jgi:hypothetical protein
MSCLNNGSLNLRPFSAASLATGGLPNPFNPTAGFSPLAFGGTVSAPLQNLSGLDSGLANFGAMNGLSSLFSGRSFMPSLQMQAPLIVINNNFLGNGGAAASILNNPLLGTQNLNLLSLQNMTPVGIILGVNLGVNPANNILLNLLCNPALCNSILNTTALTPPSINNNSFSNIFSANPALTPPNNNLFPNIFSANNSPLPARTPADLLLNNLGALNGRSDYLNAFSLGYLFRDMLQQEQAKQIPPLSSLNPFLPNPGSPSPAPGQPDLNAIMRSLQNMQNNGAGQPPQQQLPPPGPNAANQDAQTPPPGPAANPGPTNNAPQASPTQPDDPKPGQQAGPDGRTAPPSEDPPRPSPQNTQQDTPAQKVKTPSSKPKPTDPAPSNDPEIKQKQVDEAGKTPQPNTEKDKGKNTDTKNAADKNKDKPILTLDERFKLADEADGSPDGFINIPALVGNIDSDQDGLDEDEFNELAKLLGLKTSFDEFKSTRKTNLSDEDAILKIIGDFDANHNKILDRTEFGKLNGEVIKNAEPAKKSEGTPDVESKDKDSKTSKATEKKNTETSKVTPKGKPNYFDINTDHYHGVSNEELTIFLSKFADKKSSTDKESNDTFTAAHLEEVFKAMEWDKASYGKLFVPQLLKAKKDVTVKAIVDLMFEKLDADKGNKNNFGLVRGELGDLMQKPKKAK